MGIVIGMRVNEMWGLVMDWVVRKCIVLIARGIVGREIW